MIIFQKLFYRLLSLSSWLVLISSFILIAVSSFLIVWLEPESFTNPFIGFWWVMTTVTTVGYGDYSPVTVAGKMLAIFLYIFGIGLISVLISKAVDKIFLFQKRREQGLVEFTGTDHLIIIEWGKHAELALQEILHSDKEAQVVIIDQLEKTPVNHERVHYVNGNPMQSETLAQANLKKARAVFIFANEVTSFGKVIQDLSFVDGKTLLTTTAVERYYKDIYTIVEVKDRNNVKNFEHINVNEFVVSSDAVSQMAVRAAFHPGSSRIVSQLLSKQDGDDLYDIPARPHWKTYRDAFQDLLQEGATLVSDGERLNINRQLEQAIPPGARLFVICDEETYKRL